MNAKNIEWLPILASIGIGAATYSVMTGKGGQLHSLIPAITNMASGQGNAGQASQTGQNQFSLTSTQDQDSQSYS